MERKYTVMLCCLALLILTGVCLAGNTPWPKYPIPRTYSYHYYINNPNAQGCNGEGDSALCLYLSTDFAPLTQIIGINVGIHDFDYGAAGGINKAFECRLENPNTPGCPDWTAGGKLSEVLPVPYVSNWANCDQYTFTAPGPVVTPQPNIVCVVQYMPGLGPGAGTWPLVGGTASGTGSGYGYFWDASTCACFGPMNVDWWMCFFGNAPPPPFDIDEVLTNNWNDCGVQVRTDADNTAMNQGKGFRMQIQIINNTGKLYGPVDLSIWVRGCDCTDAGYSGTGLDLFAALGAGKNPKTLFIPGKGIGPIGVVLTGNMGKLQEYGFSCCSFEKILTDVPYGGTLTRREIDCALFTPIGCVDDNSAETAYYVQYPQQWGDGFAKRFIRDNMCGGEMILAVDHGICDYSTVTPLLVAAEIRLEDPVYGVCTPDTSPAGLLGTFDPTVAPGYCDTLVRRQCYDTAGNPGIPLPPCNKPNIYGKWDLDPTAWGPQVACSSTAGSCHKGFKPQSHSSYTAGGGLPYNCFNTEFVFRLVMAEPLDGGEFSGSPELATAMPKMARIR